MPEHTLMELLDSGISSALAGVAAVDAARLGLAGVACAAIREDSLFTPTPSNGTSAASAQGFISALLNLSDDHHQQQQESLCQPPLLLVAYTLKSTVFCICPRQECARIRACAYARVRAYVCVIERQLKQHDEHPKCSSESMACPDTRRARSKPTIC
eukprot:357572-Pelagomonas_calceolata.AAC.2